MALEAPDLDDRSYDDLVAEARSLISRYTPEWTNHNASDPGITMLELFAWFTDQLVYRLNRVPERNYVKFLQLLGIQTRPATPARADLTFTVAPTTPSVDVPAGAQVAAQGADGKPVVFELAEGFTAVGAQLLDFQVDDGTAFRDVGTAAITLSQTFEPLGMCAREGAALHLGFESPAGMPTAPITLMIDLPPDPRRVIEVGGVDPIPTATLAYEFFDGSVWSPLTVERDETVALTRSGRLVLFGPGAKSSPQVVGSVATARHWIRIRLAGGGYERAPRLDSIVLNTVPAAQAVSRVDEVVGGSTGLPNQGPLPLAAHPVLTADRPTVAQRSDGSVVTANEPAARRRRGRRVRAMAAGRRLRGVGPGRPALRA